MQYPDWAPQILVELHKSRLDSKSPEREYKTPDLDAIVAAAAQEYEGMTEESLENYRRYLYRTSLGLPDGESTVLLGKLLTDPRMKDVWRALAKRIDKNSDFFNFFNECEGSISAWRGKLKQTSTERKKFYKEINDTAGKLLYLMFKSDRFDLYSINALIDKEAVKWLLEALDADSDFYGDEDKNLDYAHFSLSDVTPSIQEILTDIANKAMQYSKEESYVRKPNSQNSDIHYFVRMLSSYLKNRYGQPLHEVVAVTTEVVFDRQNIDSDYVRKLVG